MKYSEDVESSSLSSPLSLIGSVSTSEGSKSSCPWEKQRHASPNMIQPAAAAAFVGSGEVGGEGRYDKYNALTTIIAEDTKIAAKQPPQGGKDGGQYGALARFPPRAAALGGYFSHRHQFPHEFSDSYHDENRMGQYMVMQHQDALPKRMSSDISSNRQHVKDAIARVKEFLKNVQHLALLRPGTSSPLYVTILTEDGGDGPQGLHSVMRRILRDRNIRFVDNAGSVQVDALSWTWDHIDDNDDDEYCDNNEDHRRRLNLRQLSNNNHSQCHEPNTEDPSSRGRRGGGSWVLAESDVLLQQQLQSYRTREEESMMRLNMMNNNEQAIMATNERLSQWEKSAARLDHDRYCPRHSSTEETAYAASSQLLPNYQTYQQHAPPPSWHGISSRPPPMAKTVVTAMHAFPQDHSERLLVYNPFDPIEHALQLTISPFSLHGRNMKCKSTITMGGVHKPDAAARETTRTHSHHYHRDISTNYGGGVWNKRGVKDNAAPVFAPSAADNRSLSPPSVLYFENRVRSQHSSSTLRLNNDYPIVSSSTLPARPMLSSPRRQRSERRRSRKNRDRDSDPEIITFSESQASQIVHTRQQVADDIQFREELEVSSNESTREWMLEARVKYEAELTKVALLQSKHTHALRQTEDERIRASEEQLIADLLVQTRIEEERTQQDEEEILRRALAKSLEDGANVDENELVAEAVQKSVEDIPADPEIMIENALRLSLEEKEMMDREEEEHLREAMEQSILEYVVNGRDDFSYESSHG